MDNTHKSCNYCTYRRNLSRHWELEDYCSMIKKEISKINMEEDCPLKNKEDIQK